MEALQKKLVSVPFLHWANSHGRSWQLWANER